ncbi:PHP domain-containing protein [Candidatus Woesearchaeota archaeon]|nr:PHP domain-containing protein [Candidatus Woesearchaeota archaeon]
MNEQERKEYFQKLQNLPILSEELADLHSHTTTSDGTLTPKELIDLALQRRLSALAITDHDTVDALPFAIDYTKNKPLLIVQGIEFSCEELPRGFEEVHILGLFIDHRNEVLRKRLVHLLEKRKEREQKMIEKLQSFGFDITFEEVAARVGVAFGRPHIAKILVEKYPQQFKTVQDVFENYIGSGKPAYIPRLDKIKVKEAISLIHTTGGIASLAHPCLYKDEDVVELVSYFVACGGDALETFYPYYVNAKGVSLEESQHKNALVQKLAQEKSLLQTGGSDFHGIIRPIMLGDCGISMEMFERLKERRMNEFKIP